MTLEAINRFVACGTFASLGNSKLLGSNVETPIRQSFGICMEFIGPCESNLVMWMDIHTSAMVRTNDFKIIELPIGMSAYNYFGLAPPELTKRALPIAEDYRPQVKSVIQLKGIGGPDSGGMTHERKVLRDLGQLPLSRMSGSKRLMKMITSSSVVLMENGNKLVKIYLNVHLTSCRTRLRSPTSNSRTA